jgi:hypothetical protein
MNVGELVAYLRLDDSKYRKTLDAAEKGAKGLGSALLKGGAGIAAIGSGVQVVGGLAAALGTAAGAALVLPAVFGAVKLATATATVGMQGFGDAMSSLDDPTAFAEAVGKLAPAAREAAVAVREQKGAWDALQLDVQQQLFEGMGKHVTRLGGTYLPILRTAMRGVAADMNYAGQKTAQVFESDAAAGRMSTALGFVREAIGNVAAVAAPLVSVLFDVFAVGAEFLPGLTGGAGEAAQAFADMVSRMRDSGELHDIISRGLSALGDLAQVAGNVGSIIGGIFRAASVDGGSFLSTLEASTQAVADMVNSADGQEALTTFFATAATLSGLFMQALSALLPVLPPLVAVLGTLAVNIGTLLVGALTAAAPYLEAFARFLQDNPGLVMGFAIALGVLVVAMNGLIAAAKIVGVVQTIMATGWIAAAAGAVSTAAAVVWSWVTMAASSIANAVVMAASWLAAFWPVALIGAIVIGLVALVIANWDSIVAFTQQAWASVTQWISDAWAAIVRWFQDGVARAQAIFAWFGLLPGLVGGWFGGMVSAAVGKGAELLAWLGGLPGRALGLLSGLGSLLINSGRALVDGFLSGIRGAWDRVVGFVRQGVQWVRDLFPFSPARTGPFSGGGYVTHSGRALTGDFAESLRAGMPGIIASARELMDAAHVELNAGLPGGSPAPGGGPVLPGPRPGEGQGGGSGVSIAIYNPAAERSSDAIGRAGSVLAALGPWED